MQENYKILGISESATDEEVENAYNTLKEKYQKDRFLEGEAGNLAAKNLTKIKTAYQEIIEDRKKKKNILSLWFSFALIADFYIVFRTLLILLVKLK